MKLSRSRRDLIVAGVCGGIAQQFGWSSLRLRVMWIVGTVLTLFAGGAILYLALCFLMPKEESDLELESRPAWKKV
jgi:phage shock protein PspC (stress-responsive transcriptional regulator)